MEQRIVDGSLWTDHCYTTTLALTIQRLPTEPSFYALQTAVGLISNGQNEHKSCPQHRRALCFPREYGQYCGSLALSILDEPTEQRGTPHP